MYYVIVIDKRDLKALKVFKTTQKAIDFMVEDGQYNGLKKCIYSNKLECAKEMYKNCDNYSCRTIKWCLERIDLATKMKKWGLQK